MTLLLVMEIQMPSCPLELLKWAPNLTSVEIKSQCGWTQPGREGQQHMKPEETGGRICRALWNTGKLILYEMQGSEACMQ
jgi:hypothetical protein